MADELADMYITMRANLDPYNRELRQGEATGDHFESHAHGVFGSVGSAVIGLAAVVGGAAIFKSIYDEAIEAQKVTAQTNAVLASTGNVAHVSASGVSDLAMALSNKNAIDDEVIQSGANLLLTFTNIRNEAGKGNDIFNQATSTILDMSAALGQDTSASAIQLGKALNDPIAGVTALRRVGVQLSDQQTEQIKVFMAHNDILSAQKVILGELNKEFGGSAAAVATPMERLGIVIKNLEETIGTALLPVIATVAEWLASLLPAALDAASTAFGAVQDIVISFYNALRTGFTEDEGTPVERMALRLREIVLPIFQTVADAVGQFFGTITSGMTDQDVATPVERLALILRNDVWPIVQQVGAFISDHLQPILISLGVAAGVLIGGAAIGGLVSILTALAAAVASPVLVIGLLVAGIIYAYQEFAGFRNVVQAVASWLTGTFVPTLQHVFDAVATQVRHLADWWSQHWNSIRDAVRNVLIAVGAVVYAAVQTVLFVWRHFGDQIMAVVTYAWSYVANIVQTAVRIVGDIIALFVDLLSGNWGKAWDDVKDILGAAWDFIATSVSNGITFLLSFFSSLPANILGAIGDLAGMLGGVAIGALQGMLGGFWQKSLDVWAWFTSLPGWMLGALGDIGRVLWDAGVKLIQGFIDGIGSMFGSVKDKLGSLTGALTSWKGPPSVDAMLLHGSGRLIIGGFIAGLESQYGAVQRSLAGLTASVGSTAVPSLATRYTSGGSLAGLTSGVTVIEHHHLITIDHKVEANLTGTPQDHKKLASDLRDPIRDALLDMPVPTLWGSKA